MSEQEKKTTKMDWQTANELRNRLDTSKSSIYYFEREGTVLEDSYRIEKREKRDEDTGEVQIEFRCVSTGE